MQTPPIPRLIAHAVVGVIAGAIVTKLLGPRAGIMGTILVLVAHEALDVPVARAVEAAAPRLT